MLNFKNLTFKLKKSSIFVISKTTIKAQTSNKKLIVIMINSKDLQMLIAHYRVNTPDEAIDLASKEFDNVVNKEREYPPFMYYMILSYLDGNMNYDKKFKDMSMTEKRKVFDETIESLKTQKLV